MNLVHFKEKQLPLADLERIGLAAGGQLLLNAGDMKALLSGRRTGLLHLENLEAETIKIKAKEVELADRTRFAYSGVDTHGIRSNKIALIASILVDGGLTFVLYKGLNALFNKKHDPEESKALSPGYFNALKDLENGRLPLTA